MNMAGLTDSDVLRICEPETDLEKRLFAMAEGDFDEFERLRERLYALEIIADDSVPAEDFRDARDHIAKLEELVKQLQQRLADHDIDYSDLVEK